MSDTVTSAERPVEQLTYSITQVVQATSLGRTVVTALLATGKLRSFTIGRRRLIPADALREFIDSHGVVS